MRIYLLPFLLFIAFFSLVSTPYAADGDINFDTSDLTSAIDDLTGIDNTVKDYLRDKTPEEISALMNLEELNVLTSANDALNDSLQSMLSNLSIASDLNQALSDLQVSLDFDPDLAGNILSVVSGDINQLLSSAGDLSSLQNVFDGVPSIQELITSVNALNQLDGVLGELDGILDVSILQSLEDTPFLQGNLNNLTNRFGIDISGFDITLPGDINFDISQLTDYLDGLPIGSLDEDVEDFLRSVSAEEFATLINLDDMDILEDLGGIFDGDLSSIIGNLGELSELSSVLQNLKTDFGFIPNNFAESLLGNDGVLGDLTDLMNAGSMFSSLQSVFGADPSPQMLVGMMNMVQQTGGSLTSQLGGMLSNPLTTSIDATEDFGGQLSAMKEEVTGEAIPEVTPHLPENDIDMPDGAVAGQCTLGEVIEIIACTEAGAKPYCDRNYSGSGAMGRYQFMPGTLAGLPSSCYSGPRSPGVGNGFECGPGECDPGLNPKPACQRHQDEAMACFTEQNRRSLENSGAMDRVGERVCQSSVAGPGKNCHTKPKTFGPQCVTITEAGLLKAAHLGGTGGARAALNGQNRCDIGCGCTFWYLNDGGHRSSGCNGTNDEDESAVCEGAGSPPDVDPGDPVDPGDGVPDEPYEPDPVVPGTPGYGSGGDDKGLATQYMQGGVRNFEMSTFEKPAEGSDYAKGTKATDDKSAQDLATGAGAYKTEDDFDFGKTMAWIEDFEQHGMAPNWAIWPSKTCLYWKPKKFFGIKTALLPACSVKVNYSEPTAMVEVVGEHGLSYLGELDDLAADSKHSDGGVGLMMSNLGLSLNQAHVFGISPNARAESSGSDKTVRRAFTCDLAVSGIDTWENMSVPGAPGSLIPNIDGATGLPDKLLTMGIPGVTALLNPTYRIKWYMGAEDKGKDVELPLLFASEEHYPEWVTKEGTLGEVRADNVPCDQNGRIKADDFSSTGLPNKSDKRCVGSWGLLEPMNGFASNGTDMANKAIVAARAYTIARRDKIYPMLAPAPTDGSLIPKIEYAHIGWKYWYTDFNIEWPYEGKQRFMLGEDTFKWDSVLMKNNYKSRGLSQWISMNLDDGYDGEDATKDGLVMTLWKRTTCRIYACCHRWSYDPSWRLFTFLGFQKKWEIKDITEIDEWDTDHSRDFNPPRL